MPGSIIRRSAQVRDTVNSRSLALVPSSAASCASAQWVMRSLRARCAARYRCWNSALYGGPFAGLNGSSTGSADSGSASSVTDASSQLVSTSGRPECAASATNRSHGGRSSMAGSGRMPAVGLMFGSAACDW